MKKHENGKRCELCAMGVEHTLRAHVESVSATRELWRAVSRARAQSTRVESRAARLLERRTA